MLQTDINRMIVEALSLVAYPGSETPEQQIEHARRTLIGYVRRDETDKIQEFFEQRHSASLLKGLSEGLTPLHYAAIQNNDAAAKLLLRYSPESLDARSARGDTPLMCAARRGHLAVFNTLLAGGAAPETRNDRGWTALSWAAFRGAVEIVKRLLGYESSTSTSAASAVIKPDLEATDEDGNTPLMIAIQNKRFEVARLLIKAGANVNVKNKMGVTPAMEAAAHWDVATLQLLSQHGADLNAEDQSGRPALVYAVEKHVETDNGYEARTTVLWLIDCGADVEAKNRHGETPLAIALGAKMMDGANVLIEAGANIDARNHFGETLLVQAGLAKNRAAVKLLIAKGVDLDAKDRKGRVALSYACLYDDIVFAEELLAAGASMSEEDGKGRLPYSFWKEGDCMSMARLFGLYEK